MTSNQDNSGPATLLAAAFYLMTAYGETACPHRGHLVKNLEPWGIA